MQTEILNDKESKNILDNAKTNNNQIILKIAVE